ncbi:MAG: diaminopimelate epimerase [Thermodesulfobacteriota bacterium]
MGRVAEQLRGLHGLKFAKMNGSGNDFVLIDNRAAHIDPALMPALARGVCARGRSVGADGLIILEPSDRVDPRLGRVDFRWHFFNADGSSAEMCGNGGRCAARFACDQGLAGPSMVFDTIAGPIRAWVEGATVKLEMVPPGGAYAGLRLEGPSGPVEVAGVNTGVPHAVVAVDDIEAAPVRELGRRLRFHQHFAPAGTNVNFVRAADGELWVRTYERGVEDETLACGTGAVASALMAGSWGWLKSPVTVRVRSGERLKVHFRLDGDKFGEVFLEGAAAYVYEASLHREAFAWMDYQAS